MSDAPATDGTTDDETPPTTTTDSSITDATTTDATGDMTTTDATGVDTAPETTTPTVDDDYTFDDVSVVMGTYNEEAAIATVLADIDAVTDGRAEVVCVDGSSDRTPEIAREHGARVV